MKILKIQQNSEEWLEYRKGKSGGSEFKNLWSVGFPTKAKIIEKLEETQPLPPADKKLPVEELAAMLEPNELAELKLDSDYKKRYYEIIAERVARPITPNDYIDQLNGQPFSMMERGHILEHEALQAFAEKTGKKIIKDSMIWVSDYDENSYVSPDGCVDNGTDNITEAVEVKCLNSADVVKAYLTGKYPEEYYPQILKYFMVNDNLDTLYFVIYTDVIPGLELQLFEIKRADVAKDISEAVAFEKETMKRVAKDCEAIEKLSF